MSEQHGPLIKTPQQLILVIVLAFVVPVTLILMIIGLVMGSHQSASSPEDVLKRIQPIGEVKLAAPSAPKGSLTGEQVYAQVCTACHGTGAAGSPKFGDKAAWGKVIAQGQPTAVKNAISGIRAMPPRGGNPDLTDGEVERAVVYMANQAGAGWKAAPPPAAVAAPGAARTGEQIVGAACGKCHQTGEGGAPKVGDRTAWTQRLKGGVDAAVAAAIKGHGGMPARGGFADLTDAEVRNAIVYMFQSGGAKLADTTAAAAAPAAPAAATAPSAPAAPAAVAPAAPAAAPATAAAAAGGANGKKVYDTVCMVCHAAGVAGAPKTGDKDAWAPRIKTGVDALYQSALKGKGAMPPKGGNTALADADVKAAVDFLVSQAK
jgi:cytochrome c5